MQLFVKSSVDFLPFSGGNRREGQLRFYNRNKQYLAIVGINKFE